MYKFIIYSVELGQTFFIVRKDLPYSISSVSRRTYQIETNTEALKNPSVICKVMQKMSDIFKKKPKWYRSVLSKKCVLDFYVALYVIFIRLKAVLHIVWSVTHLCQAKSNSKQDTFPVREDFMTMWVAPFLSIPCSLWASQAEQNHLV